MDENREKEVRDFFKFERSSKLDLLRYWVSGANDGSSILVGNYIQNFLELQEDDSFVHIHNIEPLLWQDIVSKEQQVWERRKKYYITGPEFVSMTHLNGESEWMKRYIIKVPEGYEGAKYPFNNGKPFGLVVNKERWVMFYKFLQLIEDNTSVEIEQPWKTDRYIQGFGGLPKEFSALKKGPQPILFKISNFGAQIEKVVVDDENLLEFGEEVFKD